MAWAQNDTGTFSSTVDTTKRDFDSALGGSGSGPYDTDVVAFLELDVNNMAAGDTIEVWVLSETVSTARLELLVEITGVQTDGKVRTVPLMLHDGWVFQFVQPAGSSRSFTWAVWADTLA